MGDTQLRIHLDRLVEMEFLMAHRGRQGQGFAYELLFQGEDAEGRAKLLGLIDCASLQSPSTTATSRGLDPTSRGEEANFAGRSRPVRGGIAGGSRGTITPFKASHDAAVIGSAAQTREKAHLEIPASVLSYSAVVP